MQPVVVWTYHFVMLVGYTALFNVMRLSPHPEGRDKDGFARRRWLDALKYGSGNDY